MGVTKAGLIGEQLLAGYARDLRQLRIDAGLPPTSKRVHTRLTLRERRNWVSLAFAPEDVGSAALQRLELTRRVLALANSGVWFIQSPPGEICLVFDDTVDALPATTASDPRFAFILGPSRVLGAVRRYLVDGLELLSAEGAGADLRRLNRGWPGPRNDCRDSIRAALDARRSCAAYLHQLREDVSYRIPSQCGICSVWFEPSNENARCIDPRCRKRRHEKTRHKRDRAKGLARWRAAHPYHKLPLSERPTSGR